MGDRGSRSQFALRRSFRLLGSSIPESRGGLYGLRRSLRLRSKSASTRSQSTQTASCKRRKPRKPRKLKRLSFWFRPGEIFLSGGYLGMAKFLRNQRRTNAHQFKCAYGYNLATSDDRWDNIWEKRFVVVSGKEHVFPNVGRSHGFMWVGVHGINSICAVFLNKDPDIERITDWLGDNFTRSFMNYVLSEMEDIADSPCYSDKTGGKPFAIVSLPDSSNADEASHHEASTASVNAQGAAIALLKEEVNSDSAYTDLETDSNFCFSASVRAGVQR